MFKKLYFIIMAIIGLNEWLGTEGGSSEDFLGIMLVAFVYYYGIKFAIKIFRNHIRAKGGFFSWFMSVADTSKNEQKIIDSVMRAMDQRLGSSCSQGPVDVNKPYRDRYNATNEAMWHEYQADRQKGTYGGYQHENMAKDAWNRANR